ncbi:MAG TPA: PAS domain S-box protein [Micropepsaceae bacterium]|nr:PAS domain S-box protein [Micropepsaceae bacterium]
MDAQFEQPAEEIKRLQRCMNDLVSLLALPAIWSGGDPSQIIRTLLDVLLGMLRLDFIYVRLKDPVGATPVEMVRATPSCKLPAQSQEIGETLNRLLGDDPQKWPPLVRNSIGDGDISIVPLWLGLQGEIGIIVAGSHRADFPGQTERLLLSVAANQAAIGLQEARLLNEQKRVAGELDQRVAQRTAELAAANEELKREIAERTLVEERLRQEERELNRSEARKAAILNSALDCIVTIDHEGCITEFNPAAERTFGYRRGEVMGRQLADVIIPPTFRERHRRGLAHYFATGEAPVMGRRIEMTALRADGSEFPVELAITRIPSDGPPSFTGYLRDITERKQSEEKLRRNEAYLAEAQKLSLTGSFGWDVSADEHFWSDETFRIFAYDVSTKVTLQMILERVHPEDVALVRQAIVLAADGKDLDYECRLVMPDGSVKHLHIVAHGIRAPDGGLEYIGAVQDVTERRRSEQVLSKVRSELAHVTRVTSLGALTASIAHEVNQPLSGIITNASTCLRMLAADPPNVEGARETARRTIRDGNRASDVITRLRALFGKKGTTTEAVDLNEATREVIALSSGDLQRTRVILRTDLADDLPTVLGDRVQLQQVILNLLRNASDAMNGIDDRPRQLVIRTERDEGDHARLTVQDSGVGLDPQSMDRLFEAFYTTKSNGMGIGLSVSRSIIESHHGRLWAAPNDGPGASFSFSIPRGPERISGAHSLGPNWQPTVNDSAQIMRNP